MAIGVLIKEGALPRPDLAVIADTSREKRTTWQYLDNEMQPYLDSIGLKIEKADHTLARVDLYTKDGITVMPVYTKEGRLGAYCSGEWKRDAIERWLRLQGVKDCDMWIGFSMDEVSRAKKDHRPWCRLQFPLIDKFINRAMCLSIIDGAGLLRPLKSRCWCCPHQTKEEWQEVKDDETDWLQAVSLEKAISESDPQGEGFYLYKGRQPLELADFALEGLVAPTSPCDSPYCWT